MFLCPEGILLVKGMERFKSEPYVDNGGALAIGYGHSTLRAPVVTPDLVWTEEYASSVLLDDLEYCGKIIKKWINKELDPYQYTACCSLMFNIGPGNFKESSVLQFINNDIVTYPMEKAGKAFLELDKAEDKNTKEVRSFLGLTVRRMLEGALFLTFKIKEI